jgi:hypothetical protein
LEKAECSTGERTALHSSWGGGQWNGLAAASSSSDTSSGPGRKEVVTRTVKAYLSNLGVLHRLRGLGSTTRNNFLARLMKKGAENLKKM